MDDSQDGSMERDSQISRKKDERRLFIFLVVFLFPMLAVAVVGGYGFAVWISQMFLGPPGPPG